MNLTAVSRNSLLLKGTLRPATRHPFLCVDELVSACCIGIGSGSEICNYIFVMSDAVCVTAPLQISLTEDGTAANFTRSFGMKSGYYLCYSKVAHRDTMHVSQQPSVLCVCPLLPPINDFISVCLFLQDLAGGMVVSDIQLISDKDSIPHGYCYIAEHLEPSKYTHKHSCVFLHFHRVGLH